MTGPKRNGNLNVHIYGCRNLKIPEDQNILPRRLSGRLPFIKDYILEISTANGERLYQCQPKPLADFAPIWNETFKWENFQYPPSSEVNVELHFRDFTNQTLLTWSGKVDNDFWTLTTRPPTDRWLPLYYKNTGGGGGGKLLYTGEIQCYFHWSERVRKRHDYRESVVVISHLLSLPEQYLPQAVANPLLSLVDWCVDGLIYIKRKTVDENLDIVPRPIQKLAPSILTLTAFLAIFIYFLNASKQEFLAFLAMLNPIIPLCSLLYCIYTVLHLLGGYYALVLIGLPSLGICAFISITSPVRKKIAGPIMDWLVEKTYIARKILTTEKKDTDDLKIQVIFVAVLFIGFLVFVKEFEDYIMDQVVTM